MTATPWNLDISHSHVHFSVRHLMVSKVRGSFTSWSGTLLIDDADLTKSSIEVTIQASSIDTKEAKRDEHLRSADFFDVEKFPTLSFKSTSVEKKSDDELAVHGDLTIRGISKPVTLKVELGGTVKDPWGNTRSGFEATTHISRKDFGLTWNAVLEAGGVAVADKIEIGLEIEAVKAAVAA